MRKTILFIMLFLCVPIIAASADTVIEPEIAYAYELNTEELKFEVANTSTEHPFFEQFSVNDNNWYAVYYRYTEAEGSRNGSYERAYIEIYDSDSILIKEISFYTTEELAIQLIDTSLNIYFGDHMITYSLDDGSLCGYRYAKPQQSILTKLRYEELTVGVWTYQSESAMHGYTKLVRTNGTLTQVLISLPGSGFAWWNTILPALLIGTICIVAAIVIKHRKK